MAAHYKSQMTSYIDSNWSEGLNLLAYRCKTKCYLYRRGNQCTALTGGWSTWQNRSSSGQTWQVTTALTSSYIQMYAEAGEKNQYTCGGYIAAKSVNLSGYSTLSVTYTNSNNGSGYNGPVYDMITGFRSSYSTDFDIGSSTFGNDSLTIDAAKLISDETTVTGSISSASSGYPALGINQGGASNNDMYHRWYAIALIP